MKTLYERISPYLTKTRHEALGECQAVFDKAVKHLLTQKRRSKMSEDAALIAAKAACVLWAA